ncbi:MAG: hypothetical protein QW156_03190 [Candidatus Aenigmatarchaeota archaeon]
MRKVEFNENVCFILGDHLGLNRNEEKFLKRVGVKKISLGKIEYLASHCITIVHYELDRKLS